MKLNKRLLAFVVSIFTISLPGCSCNFRDMFSVTLRDVDIVDYNRAYLVGDVYDTDNALTITGTYSDGSTLHLPYMDCEVILTKGDEVINHYAGFPSTGEYELKLVYEGVISNTLTINVVNEHVYADSITLHQDYTEIDVWEEYEFTIDVSPDDYTAPIKLESSNNSAVRLMRSEKGMIVYGLEAGEVDITARIADSKTTTISSSIHLKINSSISSRKMSKTYNDVVKNSAYTISACPTSGDVKLLVIPVWFSDSTDYISSGKKETVRGDIYNAYFGSSTDTGWESVSSYYYKESGGDLNLTGTISAWYNCGVDTATAGNYNKEQMKNFVRNATTWYFVNHPTDPRSNYDSDNDGYIDGIMFIYAAADSQTSEKTKNLGNLWAYTFWVQDNKEAGEIIPNVFFWASYDFIYGDNATSRTGKSYHNGDTSHYTLDAHTYIHEMGHVFGLDDYYDYGGYKYNPAGGFSMQDCNVGGHDAFSLLSLGWAKAYVPTESMDITLRSFQSSHETIILTPEFNSKNSPFDEYLLLELYTPDGLNYLDSHYQYHGVYPSGTTSIGVRLWHVDARLFVTTSSGFTFVTNPSDGKVRVAFTNTYYKNADDLDYVTDLYPFDHNYAELNILQLIRNDKDMDYHPTTYLSKSDLFRVGDTFSMNTFSNQFYEGKAFNSGKANPWSFEVKEISTSKSGEAYARITLSKS